VLLFLLWFICLLIEICARFSSYFSQANYKRSENKSSLVLAKKELQNICYRQGRKEGVCREAEFRGCSFWVELWNAYETCNKYKSQWRCKRSFCLAAYTV